MTNNQLESLNKSLIVSCQAPFYSPLHDANIIAAMAQAALLGGASAVRIDTPSHIKAVRDKIKAPIIGLWKQQISGYEVYITPQFHQAAEIAKAGADIIAIDATLRERPNNEKLETIIAQIHQELGKLVMADIDTIEAAIAAAAAGADIIGTTLYGYTQETKHLSPPGFELLTEIVKKLNVPVICEGGIASPEMAQQALKLGAFAVVVGTDITGIDYKVKAYQAAVSSL